MKMQGNNKLFDHFTPRYDCRRTKERYREECGQQKQRRKTDSHESGIFSSYLQLTTNIPSETKTVYNS